MKVSELLETLKSSGIIKQAYIGFIDITEFTGPHEISKILTDPAFIDYRISEVKLWSVESGLYVSFLWVFI